MDHHARGLPAVPVGEADQRRVGDRGMPAQRVFDVRDRDHEGAADAARGASALCHGRGAFLRRGGDDPYGSAVAEAADPQTVRELYGAERYDRLAQIKRQHDPVNMFRVNHNIEPAAAVNP